MSDAIPLMLVRMVLKGQVQLEALDKPSWGWLMNERDAIKSVATRNLTPVPYRNLAREWISANPAEWAAMQKEQSDAKS